jgi:hypothetical protein
MAETTAAATPKAAPPTVKKSQDHLIKFICFIIFFPFIIG